MHDLEDFALWDAAQGPGLEQADRQERHICWNFDLATSREDAVDNFPVICARRAVPFSQLAELRTEYPLLVRLRQTELGRGQKFVEGHASLDRVG
ncbi:MAG: hypothetical protein AW09_002092 [Candidatus Accumulibacter phosphatis]|uniref:Uncharacterized protein n=1 Tax=Candidatus Accumulibacter phosphatis TaxID=327160 RepID=A0A080M6I6_9PROT|nr:MAG: hypothetical protein AW09_002092 [Candidatus Accumulibacter phosphatis]